jgi:hypothetical protein
MMERRKFLTNLIGLSTAALLAPEEILDRLTWRPKLISIPAPAIDPWEQIDRMEIRFTRRMGLPPPQWIRLNAGVEPLRVFAIIETTPIGLYRRRMGLTQEEFAARHPGAVELGKHLVALKIGKHGPITRYDSEHSPFTVEYPVTQWPR